MLFAVAVMPATPDPFVRAVPADRAALGPLCGAAKNTLTPLSTFPPASLTTTWSGCAKAVSAAADWGVFIGVRLAGPPGAFVKWNNRVAGPAVAVMK